MSKMQKPPFVFLWSCFGMSGHCAAVAVTNFSLPEYVPQLVTALSASRKPDVAGLRGGASPSGIACYPTGWNNFTGMEREVSEVIGDWVRKSIGQGRP